MAYIRIVDPTQVSINIVRVQSGDLLLRKPCVVIFSHGMPPFRIGSILRPDCTLTAI
jgi:hypothetical protein